VAFFIDKVNLVEYQPPSSPENYRTKRLEWFIRAFFILLLIAGFIGFLFLPRLEPQSYFDYKVALEKL
jgi:hypothetical protein